MLKKLDFIKLSLVNKMLLLNIIGVTTAMCIVLLLLSTSYYYFARQSLGEKVYAQANLLATNIAPMLVFFDIDETHKLAKSFQKIDDIRRVTVYDNNNTPIVDLHSATLPVSIHNNLSSFQYLKPFKQFDKMTVTVFFPVNIEKERLGTVVIEGSTKAIRRNILLFISIGSIATVVGIILSVIILRKLQMLALNPIIEMAQVAERVAEQKDYTLRIKISGKDEIAGLAARFNQMLEKVEFWDRGLTEELIQSRETEKHLGTLARTDALTQLPNRLAFKSDIDTGITDSQENDTTMLLMIIDLDDFKIVNDRYGHKVGDFVLQVAARKIAGTLREHDTLYRFGGDEFAAIVYEIDSNEQIELVCRRIIEKVALPIDIADMDQPIQVTIGASIGVAQYPADSQTTGDLFHCADLAMYESKKKGKNSFTIYEAGLNR